jgi:hypothetical protein
LESSSNLQTRLSGLNASCFAYPYRHQRALATAEAFFEHMTTMHEGMGTANDQIMSGGLFGAIVAR